MVSSHQRTVLSAEDSAVIRASIIGRCGGDPKQRETRNGKPMTTVSLAVDVGKPGEEATEWISLVAFGTAAEALAQHAKGDLISAMGPLTRSTFEGRDGETRTGWSLVTESLLSVKTTYDRPGVTDAPVRPQRSRTHAPPLCGRRRAGPPNRNKSAPIPDLPADRLDDLWNGPIQ